MKGQQRYLNDVSSSDTGVGDWNVKELRDAIIIQHHRQLQRFSLIQNTAHISGNYIPVNHSG